MMQLSKRTEPSFRETPRGMVLVATRNPGRSDLQFPPPEFVYGGAAPDDVEIGPIGSLYSFTIVHASKDKPPYALAMVDFEPGVRVFGRLLEGDSPAVIDGMVRVVPHELSDGTPDYAFSPI